MVQMSQRSGPADWFLNPGYILRCSDCYQRPRWWGTYCPMIFTILDPLENLTPVWKCIEIKLPSVSCLYNLERLSFVICLQTKDLLHHHPRHDFIIFGQIYQIVNCFLTIIWKEKANKVSREVSTLFQRLWDTLYILWPYCIGQNVVVVKGDQKAPFPIAATPRCRGGHYSFPLDCSTLTLILTW